MNTSEPLVPNLAELGHIQQLCDLRDPYRITPELEELFVEAMNENFQWHRSRSPFFDQLLTASHWHPTQALHRIPFVSADFFKAHEIVSVPRDNIYLHLTSSGTTGQKSQMFFDQWTLTSAQRMVDSIFQYYGWITPSEPTNYLLYSYESKPGSKLGTAYTDNFLCKYAPVNQVFHALRHTGSSSPSVEHEFDVFGCIDALNRFAVEGLPVRLFGFPAFLHFTLKRMRDLGLPPLRLPAESLVFFGGGWKGHADRQIGKPELYAEITELLGIPDDRIRDGYGSVEHCVPYVECRNHQFHVPVWSRVFIRDVATLEPLGFGKQGFLHLVSPYITSAPASSVLMGDLASLFDASSCGCGINTPYFVVHGRAGTSKNRSCAVAASELLKGRA